jgi:predicted ATPase
MNFRIGSNAKEKELMITRFYVDNYKCLQNFEYKPKQFELVVGANGSGKSTVFEALDKVRRFVSGEDARDLFSDSSETRWSNNPVQTFEVDFDYRSAILKYRLEVNLSSVAYRIEKETLSDVGGILVESSWEHREGKFDEDDPFGDHAGEARIFKRSNAGGKYTLSNPNLSILNSIYGFHFPPSIWGIHFIRVSPPAMIYQVKRSESRPTNDLANFASYYIYVLQQQQGKMFEMIPHLKEVISGFDSFEVKENFEEAQRELFIVCRTQDQGKNVPIRYRFDELSDGQRALIALYTLLFCTLDEDTTIVIDEPENYVALRELQPWLSLLQERLEERGGQVILISHHPEFINALAGQTTVFERYNGGPVRVKAFDAEAASTLAPAEIVARGWES